MKRKLSTALVMLLAFVLLIGTTAITASAAETTYEPIGGSTTIVKNLVVDADANIPTVTFSYTIRRGTPQDATATTIEILESPLGGGSIGTAAFSNADTANTINVVTGSKLKLPERKERVDMCKAIEQMRNDSVQEGRISEAYVIAKRMLERGKNTVEEIAEDTGLPIETIRELAGEKSA